MKGSRGGARRDGIEKRVREERTYSRDRKLRRGRKRKRKKERKRGRGTAVGEEKAAVLRYDG
jgi:hypothetical protein